MFLEEVKCFFIDGSKDDINVESATKYVAGKHQIFITMNISGSRVIHIMIVLCLCPPSVSHLYFISKSSQN